MARKGPGTTLPIAILLAAAFLLCPDLVSAQPRSTPVPRDPTVSTVAYSEFDGKTAEQIWHLVNGLEFWAMPTAPPTGFYDAIDASSSASLRTTLHSLVRNARVFRYTHASRPGDASFAVDTWDIIALADAHPHEPGMVLDIYMNATFPRQLSGPPGAVFKYDREHSWPKSLGFPLDALTNPPYSDVHHLFAAYSSYNGSRSNKPYGDGESTPEAKKITVENIGRGGTLEPEENSSNYSFRNVWQTWLGRRGDVARALMYMDVRYEGTSTGSHSEPDLRLTDDATKIVNVDAASSGQEAFMGLLSVLLRWHEEDPVDDLERRRNTVTYLFQGNRNPFVDNPEWVGILHGGAAPAITTAPWINEFHYDNVGADVGEFVEIAGPADLDLSGWRVLGYNGTGGKVYRTIELSGKIPNLQNGFGALAFDFPGMQNGPDGIALVDPSDRVIELLSYEGTFTGTDGLAAGVGSTLIPVEQPGNTPIGFSLQLRGRGGEGSAFDWEGPLATTRGAVNRNQELGR